ncbi:MAG: LacI family DNA-binding transcriptional regulator [Clostridia bacterium]|nr:LacI family DNA-binding transcriptional regulator [Clostridia bacterium]MCL6521708.1 LacI family transcriptional regulator [Bacillota bacterium]
MILLATIREVATLAGVSPATVSRVLNGRGPVREATRRRVLEAVEALGFTPNGLARGLAKGVTRTIGLVLPDIANPYFPALARGVADAARAAGFAVILGNSDNDPEQEAAHVRVMRERWVDGLIIASSGQPERLSVLVGQVPVVLIDRRATGWAADSVSTDNRLGGRLAVAHLLARGRRRIAHLGGPAGVASAADRALGFSDALREAGLEPDPRLVSQGPFDFASGYERTRALIEGGVDFDAIFAANDLLAVGAIQACQDAGLEVPARVAVVGFDDILLARLVRPRLTTVVQPAYRVGALAWERLSARIAARAAGAAGGPPVDVQLTPRLAVRESA